jgi:hypothetical protein
MIYQFFYLISNKSIHILNSIHMRVTEVLNNGAQMLQYMYSIKGYTYLRIYFLHSQQTSVSV